MPLPPNGMDIANNKKIEWSSLEDEIELNAQFQKLVFQKTQNALPPHPPRPKKYALFAEVVCNKLTRLSRFAVASYLLEQFLFCYFYFYLSRFKQKALLLEKSQLLLI